MIGFIPGAPLPGRGNKKPAISPQTKPQPTTAPPLRGASQGTGKQGATEFKLQARGSNTRTTTATETGGKRKSRGKKTRTDNSKANPMYIPPVFQNSDSSSNSDGDSFSQKVDRSPFFDDHNGDPVFFNMPLDVVYATQQLDKPLQKLGYINPRLSFNLSRYSDPSAFTATIATTEVTEQFRVIYNMQTRDVKQKVRSGTLLNKWNFANWYQAIMTVCEALEVFYSLDSILSYTGSSTVRDKNKAMLMYRELFESSELFYNKDILRRNLKGAWFPVSWSRLIQWTYQNYRVSDLPQSEMIRFLPNECFVRAMIDDNVVMATNALLDAINLRLVDDNTTSIFSMLAQVYPEGEINGLPYSSNTSHFDRYILEVFSNQPVIYTNDSVQKTFPNSVQTMADEGYFYYGSMFDPSNESKVGLPFVLQTIYDDNDDVFIDFFKAFRATSYGTEGTVQYYNTNKFNSTLVGPVYVMDARNIGISSRFNTCPDVHLIKQNFVSGQTNYQHSAVRSPMQPVYFDIKQSPLITIREFMTSLFGL